MQTKFWPKALLVLTLGAGMTAFASEKPFFTAAICNNETNTSFGGLSRLMIETHDSGFDVRLGGQKGLIKYAKIQFAPEDLAATKYLISGMNAEGGRAELILDLSPLGVTGMAVFAKLNDGPKLGCLAVQENVPDLQQWILQNLQHHS